MLIDTHCHLDAAEFDADRDAVAARARACGVTRVVIPAVARANFDTVRALAAREVGCAFASGIHPMYTPQASEHDLAALDAELERGGQVAVGEIGLDYFVPGLDGPKQERFFAEQLKLARAHGLPVLLHVRRAQDAILRQLRRIRVAGGIAHAFNGSRQQAEEFIRLGFALGFGGAMTYPRALRIRELAATLPWDAIVLETDAPDIAPEFARGERNEPAHLVRIAGVLAELRAVSLQEVAERTTQSALRVLPALGSLAHGGDPLALAD
ncbi:MAG: TatD family hydrolase [Rhodocyclaceae bacterium]|nr:TatD family hydrolase [Rhodocyclaceae bacterium]